MKYYAVTDDPRELYHYGVKGMKWGQHIFGDRPKSPGYHKALKKLRAARDSVKSFKNTVQSKVSSANQARQERNYKKAVKAAQKRIELITNVNRYDEEKAADKRYTRDLYSNQKKQNFYNGTSRKQFAINEKINKLNEKRKISEGIRDVKNLKKYTKTEKNIDKFTQKARKGKLKYGKLTADQVQQVQDRLQLEANTRRFGSQEKTWRQQKKEARRAGYLQGITRGTAAGMEEVARAGTQVGIKHILDRMKLDAASKQDAQRQGEFEKIKNRAKNKKTRSEIREDIKQQTREMEYKEGNNRTAKRYRKFEELGSNRQFNLEESHHALQSARQQRELEERNERALEEAGRNAYLYGYIPGANSNNNGGNKKGNKEGNKGNKLNIDNSEVDNLSKWYEMKYINKTNKQEIEAKRKAGEEAAKEERRRKRKEAEARRQQKVEEENKRKFEEDTRAEKERFRKNTTTYAEEKHAIQARKDAEEAAAAYRARQEAKAREEREQAIQIGNGYRINLESNPSRRAAYEYREAREREAARNARENEVNNNMGNPIIDKPKKKTKAKKVPQVRDISGMRGPYKTKGKSNN